MRKVIIKECCICGAPFEAHHGGKRICPECEEVITRNKRGFSKTPFRYAPPYDLVKYEQQTRKQNLEAYRDTIVAEGYADRQRAKTLARVEPIKTTL